MKKSSENLTIELIRSIGSPFVSEPEKFDANESMELYDLAFENNIDLLYLNVLKSQGRLNSLRSKYEELENRCHETLVTITRVARLLNSKRTLYAVTKTLRPYPATPNDVDIFYLGPSSGYQMTIDMMIEGGYILQARNPKQALFYDPRDDSSGSQVQSDRRGGVYYLELYREPAADYFVYLDNKKLRDHITTICLDKDQVVSVFDPGVELTVVLMHTIVMHRFYPLEVFYTMLYYFSEMTADKVEEFLCFVKQNNAVPAVCTGIAVAALLHEAAFNSTPEILTKMLTRLGSNGFEVNRLKKNDFRMPHKIGFPTFIAEVLSKLREPKSLGSFGVQLLHMSNPVFAAGVVRSLKKKYEHV